MSRNEPARRAPSLPEGWTRRACLTAGLGLAGMLVGAGPSRAGVPGGLPGALTAAGGAWRLSFAEDFCDGSGFDSRWIKVTAGGDQHVTDRLPENVVAAACDLDLRLGHQDHPRRPFTGGYAKTRHFRQTYGYFECAMRIADEPGVNNAFWLVSHPDDERDGVMYELDIAEAKAPDRLNLAVHRWRPGPKWAEGHQVRLGLPLADGVHRYGLLWTPERLTFFFDDRQVWETDNPVAHSPAEIRLSNAVGAFAGVTDGDVRGAATRFDWVRVFRAL